MTAGGDLLRTIDRRVERIEAMLPALATREELRAAVAPLASREELRAAVAPLATRAEMHAAIAAATAPLATRDELRAGLADVRAHSTMLFEDLRDDVRIVLEHVLTLSTRVDELARR